MAALEDLGLLGPIGAITLLCGGDEETDMRVSLAVMQELASQHDIALVLECGRENGDIVGARKGGGNFVLKIPPLPKDSPKLPDIKSALDSPGAKAAPRG